MESRSFSILCFFFFFCCCFIEPLLSCTPVFGEKAIESAIEKKKKKAELQMAPLLLFFFFYELNLVIDRVA